MIRQPYVLILVTDLYNSTSASWMGRSTFGFGFTTMGGGGASSKGNLKFAREELDEEMSA